MSKYMEPIKNSWVKEQIRQKNETAASNEKTKLERNASNRIGQLNRSLWRQPSMLNFFWAGVALAVALYLPIAAWLHYGNWMRLGPKGLLPGFLIGNGLGVLVKGIIYLRNEAVKSEAARLENQCKADLAAIDQRTDEKTRKEIKAYDEDVKACSLRIGKNRAGLDRMVWWLEQEFDASLAECSQKAANMERYISVSYTFTVMRGGIRDLDGPDRRFYRADEYDFDFTKERYRCLDKDAECEGLACVLARILVHDLGERYKKQHCDVKMSHMDAKVTISFRMPNKNFVTATVIV